MADTEKQVRNDGVVDNDARYENGLEKKDRHGESMQLEKSSLDGFQEYTNETDPRITQFQE